MALPVNGNTYLIPGYDEYNEVSETESIQDIATLPEQARATSKTWPGLPVEESVIIFFIIQRLTRHVSVIRTTNRRREGHVVG